MDNHSPGKHIVTASAHIPARRERVHSVIANYPDGHPRVVPKQFTGMVVEHGGIGAGTIIRFQMRIFGRKQTFRAAITEPEPGRMLVETDLDANGAVTTLTVNPDAAPADCQVTISTELKVRGGVMGVIERTLSTLLLRPLYIKELENLARVATGPIAA
jgi:hypothetical protein